MQCCSKSPLPLYALSLALMFSCGPLAAGDEMELVTVTGHQDREAMELEQDLTPGGVTVIDSASLYERNVSSVADMLRYVPGVWSSSSSGSDSIFISSRGSNLDATDYDMNGIKLSQDGLPVTTADGNNHNRIIDPLASRFISIARGANALKYGASTLGGAIDFVSPTALNSAPLQLYLSGGSYAQALARLSAARKFNDSLDALVTLEGKRRDGYRDHNDSERYGLYANLGWRVAGNIETRFFGTYIDNEEELPGALTTAEFEADPRQANPLALGGHYQKNVETLRLANKTTIHFSETSSLELGFSLERQFLFHPIVDKVLVDFDGPGPLAPQEVFSLLIDTDHKDKGVMARYRLQHGQHNIVLGFNWGENDVTGGNYRNDGGRRNGLSTLIDNYARSLEAYVMDRWQISEHWTLIYGLQAVDALRHVSNTDVRSGALRSPTGNYDSINPRAGVIYQWNEDVSLFANVSRLYEAPTNFELEDDLRGNQATLDAMHGVVVELGSRGRHALSANSFWHWDIAAYYASLNDEILSQDDPLAPGTSLTANVDDTTHAGIEALIGASFALASGMLEPLLNLTYNHFRFDNDAVYGDRTLPAAPAVIIHGEVLYRHSEGFFAGPTFDWVDDRYADFMNTRRIDSYFLLGLRSGYQADKWQVFLEARNLFDEDYVATHSVVNIANADSRLLNPGEPRSLYVGYQLSF